MKTLDYEVNRIRNELADIGCRTMFGMSCFELIKKICDEVIENMDVLESVDKLK